MHWWLPIGGSEPWLLRLPSVLFYLAGLLLLAFAAQRIGGQAAFAPTVYIGVLWPFGFHFGRLAGWYSFCFFLVAAMTIASLRCLDRPSWRRFAMFAFASLLLVYSNYYGWAVVSCLAFDMYIRKSREAGRFVLATFGILIVAYIPLFAAFKGELLSGMHIQSGPPVISQALNSIYNLYSLLVSESVAPWFWYASIPVSAAILLSLTATAVLLPRQGRAFLAYFALLFGGLAALGIIGTKRLLFISPWLLLSFSVALANRKAQIVRAGLAISLAFIAAVGWAGVFARKYYAAPHFIEPWSEIADEAAQAVKKGGVVVANSPSFRFYANYSFRNRGMLKGRFFPGWIDDPRVLTAAPWPDSGISGPSQVLFVDGVNISEAPDRAEAWLLSNCAPGPVRQVVPDTGYALKNRFFQTFGQRPFRISLRQFQCPPQP